MTNREELMKNESTSASNADVNFLIGGGEMGARMREWDWSKAPWSNTAVATEFKDCRANYADLPPTHVCLVGRRTHKPL